MRGMMPIQKLVNAQTHINRAVFEANERGRVDYLLSEVEAALVDLKHVRKILVLREKRRATRTLSPRKAEKKTCLVRYLER